MANSVLTETKDEGLAVRAANAAVARARRNDTGDWIERDDKGSSDN